MKRKLLTLLVAFCATTCLWANGFDFRDRSLGTQIYENNIIKNQENITLTEMYTTAVHNYEINCTSGGTCSFSIGGVTFWYSNSNDGTTAYKTYNTYIQPNGNKRKVIIPVINDRPIHIGVQDAVTVAAEGLTTSTVDLVAWGTDKDVLTTLTPASGATEIVLWSDLRDDAYTAAKFKLGAVIYEDNSAPDTLKYTATSQLIATQWMFNDTILSHTYSDGQGTIIFKHQLLQIEESAFKDCTGLISIDIPNSVTSIGKDAFYGCKSLTSITLPNCVTSIGEEALGYCEGLTTISVRSANTHYAAVDGVLFNYEQDVLIQYPMGNTRTKYDIPSGVTSIGNNAFSGCTGLTSIIIPKSVTSIGNSTFYGCSGLNSITCFATIPPSLSIGVFTDVPSSLTIYVPNQSIAAYKTANQWKDFNIKGILVTNVNNKDYGEISPSMAQYLDSCILTAISNYGYHFLQWSDGVTDNPRTVAIAQNVIYTAEFAKNKYTITTSAENGEITGAGTYEYLDTICLAANAVYGYHFVRWNDGNTDNPRNIVVTRDATYTAEFTKNTYVITTSAEHGTVTGAGTYNYQNVVSLRVTADYGYHFVQWSDGNTDNPRSVFLTQDTTFTAEFAKNCSGACGDNLNWHYTNGFLYITGSGAMYDYTDETQPWILFRDSITFVDFSGDITSIGSYAFYGLTNRGFTKLVLPQTITTIGAYAFANCSRLTSITLSASLLDIADYAFSGCISVTDITCMASTRPDVYENTFNNVSKYAYLYVLCESMQSYKTNGYWSHFDIKCAGAEEATTTDLTVTPGTTDATFTWPTNTSADTYNLQIKKDGVVFCTLVFNANGQLTSIAFAPSRNGTNKATAATATANGYRFTVTGLSEASHYTYNFDVKDASQKSLKTYTGEFNTNGLTPIDNIHSDAISVEKFIQNGKLYIRTANGIFDATGRMIE